MARWTAARSHEKRVTRRASLNKEGQGNEGTAEVAPYHNSAQARGHTEIKVAIEA